MMHHRAAWNSVVRMCHVGSGPCIRQRASRASPCMCVTSRSDALIDGQITNDETGGGKLDRATFLGRFKCGEDLICAICRKQKCACFPLLCDSLPHTSSRRLAVCTLCACIRMCVCVLCVCVLCVCVCVCGVRLGATQMASLCPMCVTDSS